MSSETLIRETLIVSEGEALLFETEPSRSQVGFWLTYEPYWAWIVLADESERLPTPPTVRNFGQIIARDLLPAHQSFGSIALGIETVGFWAGVTIENYGLIAASSATQGAGAIHASSWSPSILNAGIIRADAPSGSAVAISTYGQRLDFGPFFYEFEIRNAFGGEIVAEGESALAFRTIFASLVNDGTIHAIGGPQGSWGVTSTGGTIQNNGSIAAQASAGAPAVGIQLGAVDAFNSPRDTTIVNRGHIEAITAIDEMSNYGVRTNLDNSGSIVGNVMLYDGDDVIRNSGSIVGNVTLGAGSDLYDGRGGSISGTVAAGDGDDTVNAGSHGGNVDGGAGSDTLIADYSNQALGIQFTSISGAGVVMIGATASLTTSGFERVILTAGSGDDQIITGGGDDIIRLGVGGGVVDVGSGIDIVALDFSDRTAAVVYSHSSTEAIARVAGVSAVTVRGAESIEILGGSAADILTGGAGSDVFEGGAGGDSLDGGAGFDIASYASSNAKVSIQLNGAVSGGDAEGDLLRNIEGLIGSTLDDVLIGDAGANRLDGERGADRLVGMGGNDTYLVDNAADVVDELPNEGDDVVIASISWRLAANVERIELTGQSNLHAFGNGLDNVLIGNAGDNILSGGAGADRLDGGAGFDTISYAESSGGVTLLMSAGTGTGGDAEGDSFVNFEAAVGSNFADTLQGGQFADWFEGGAGSDFIDGGLQYDTSSYASSKAAVHVDMFLGIAEGGDAEGDTLVNIDGLMGSAFDDLLFGSYDSNGIEGGDGNDLLSGYYGNDRLDGGLGFDTASYAFMNSGVTVDLAFGHATKFGVNYDLLVSIEGVIGTVFDDLIAGDAANNTLRGLTGEDVLTGNAGNDILLGGPGNDELSGGADIDTASYTDADSGVTVSLALTGGQNTLGAGIDTLTSIESLMGSAFGDTLSGNADSNTLDGGLGADFLDGGLGADRLDGGAGDDTIIWDAGDELASVLGGDGIDMLVFTSGAAPTGFDLTAHGFELAENRLTDTGANAWASITTSYDSAWRANFVTVLNDNGSRSELDYDQLNAFSWATNFNAHDVAGRLDLNVTVYDTGVTAAYDFDQANGFNWVSNWNQYAASGALDINVTEYDNGTVTSNDFDQDDAFNWASNWIQNDPAGKLDLNVTIFDSGVTSAYDFDQDNIHNWASNWNQYDANGALDINVTVFDDGRMNTKDFDQANAFGWASNFNSYDADGAIDFNVVVFDNGNTAVLDYDQANAFAWASIWQLYDPNGNVIGYHGVTDDGSFFGP